jgi:nitrite reductase/ring-hydroxylating ferredoxin subunit/alkylhydroperoxidase/carboxymuconolactone decarboxylase family protein YurZ
MSRALDYLLEVRPDALGPYFAFLKAAGRRLDPRTRALISLLSKVHAQTPAGFRQYLKRALAAGVTPDEVLDALLAAFPMLGFSRIVWAAEQLLALDLPEFRPERLAQPPLWHTLARRDAIPQGTSRHVCAGRAVFVHRTGATLAVYDARCPHQGTEIPDAAIAAGRLTCPRHGWVFDAASGACVEGGDRPLRALAHRIEAGEVQVQI